MGNLTALETLEANLEQESYLFAKTGFMDHLIRVREIESALAKLRGQNVISK